MKFKAAILRKTGMPRPAAARTLRRTLRNTFGAGHNPDRRNRQPRNSPTRVVGSGAFTALNTRPRSASNQAANASRVAMLTGLYPRFGKSTLWREGMVTAAEVLRGAGYGTGM